MPPIQLERQRQNIRLFGKSAYEAKPLAPVVVSPLADSKNACGKRHSTIKIYGRLPTSDAIIQPVPTMHIASFLNSLRGALRLGR